MEHQTIDEIKQGLAEREMERYCGWPQWPHQSQIHGDIGPSCNLDERFYGHKGYWQAIANKKKVWNDWPCIISKV